MYVSACMCQRICMHACIYVCMYVVARMFAFHCRDPDTIPSRDDEISKLLLLQNSVASLASVWKLYVTGSPKSYEGNWVNGNCL